MSINTRVGKANWTIRVKDAAEKRGIANPYQLWLKIGGSKATTSQIWDGSPTMVRMETLNRIQELLGISPHEILVNADDFS